MNKLFTLELLGYKAGEDFNIYFDNSFEWLSSDPLPSDETLQQTWNQHIIDSSPEVLKNKKEDAGRFINNQAESKRLEYITSGSGQALVYQHKVEQAQEFISGGSQNIENYPFIQKEANARNMSPADFANLVIQKRNEWESVGSTIEAYRAKASEDISSSQTVEDIESILSRYENELSSI